MTDAPRTIHAHPLSNGSPCDGWDFEGWWHVDPNANGPGERYHHDAVVRELVEALEKIADLSVVAASDMAVIALRKHRSALAKIAQENPHD